VTAVQQLGTAVVKMVLAGKKERLCHKGIYRRNHTTCDCYRLLCEGFRLVCGVSSLPLWSDVKCL